MNECTALFDFMATGHTVHAEFSIGVIVLALEERGREMVVAGHILRDDTVSV